ncbi:MAG: DNA primase [Erysipelotrichaceae bacterium]
MRLSEDLINEIRSKADIGEIISTYVPLSKKGKNLWCTCPFHDDHAPSMSVSLEKQIYKCFVCGEGGNVFNFVSKIENIPFVEAVVKVAELANIPIDIKLTKTDNKPVDPLIKEIYEINQEAIDFTNYAIGNVDAKFVRDYLEKRGITKDIIEKFTIGYNPSGSKLYQFLNAKKHTDELLTKIDLVRAYNNGFKDVFAERILIPIHNEFGKPVGFTGRRLLENEDAKYINTASTPVYEKGNIVFNYHRAKKEIKDRKCVYLLEGAMDVISLEKIGITNAVATLGTACTNEQVKQIKNLHTLVRIFYDGDQAGINATYKFGQLAKQNNIQFEIVNNQYKMDPDEIIDCKGKEELIAICNKTISWIEFLFKYLPTKYNLENYSQKKQFAETMLEEIKLINEDFEKRSAINKLKTLTGFDVTQNFNQQQAIQPAYEKRAYTTMPKKGYARAEYEILSMMLISKAACNHYKEKLGFFISETSNSLAYYIIDYYRNNEQLNVAQLIDYIKEQGIKNYVTDIVEWELAMEAYDLETMDLAITKIKRSLLEKQIREKAEEARLLTDPMLKAKAFDEIIEMKRKRGDMLKETKQSN